MPKNNNPTRPMFRDPSGQTTMFDKSYEEELEERKNQPVECLGMTFPNDDARRAYFLAKLEEKLQDPAFRAIEGFPIGTDEDILALSDPPYYTACPNPFLQEFIRLCGRSDQSSRPYSVEPYAGDLEASRNNPFVNAHSYATKVPHEIVTKLILHYTQPEDLVLDAFAGTAMTAVGAQLCSDVSALSALGLRQLPSGQLVGSDGHLFGAPGARNIIVGDLCPAATFLAANFNLPYNKRALSESVEHILLALEAECGWMNKTRHSDGFLGDIVCTLWSDVFVCAECGREIVFWDAAVNTSRGVIEEPVCCPYCSAKAPKRHLEHAWSTFYDDALGSPMGQAKKVPVLLVYDYEGSRYEKVPDDEDRVLLDRVAAYHIPHWFPTDRMPDGEESRRNDSIGLTHVHHFFTRRNLASLACAWAHADTLRAKFMLTSLMYKSSVLCGPLMSNYFAAKRGKSRGGWVGKERSGTLYCPSIHSEVSVWSQILSRATSTRVTAASGRLPFISTASATDLRIPANSIDYIFTDPPFGSNRMYSELNFLWEAWLRVQTDNTKEAISNKAQGKGLPEYEGLMRESFVQYHRVLKPGRWISVEFSNTSNAIWNALQNALLSAGFVVADVRSLDKEQGSILGYTTATAARQDLVISAYKPNCGLEQRFRLEAGSEDGAWDFVRTHLRQLPVFVAKEGRAEVIAERQNYLLYDRMVAFHVQRGITVPLSAAEFYAGLRQRFPERDGMFFLPDQAAEYDRKRLTVREVQQLQLIVTDESSAIQWLRQQLERQPQTFQELHPQFLREIGGWSRNEKSLELSTLLEQSFLRYDGTGEVPGQVRRYLSGAFKELRDLPKDDPALRARAKDRWYVPDPNEAGDLEKLRERALLREFDEYVASTQRRLRVFRLEAVRAGFKRAWQARDYQTIIAVAEKIPESVLQEDPKLLMWYDQAVTRSGGIG